VIFGLYGYFALPFIIVGMVTDLVRGPRPPRPLKKKIKILGLATLATIAVLFTNFLFGSETWSGSIVFWAVIFSLGPGVVYVVSVLSLSIQHFVSTQNLDNGSGNS
jgi:hypothetical protein